MKKIEITFSPKETKGYVLSLAKYYLVSYMLGLVLNIDTLVSLGLSSLWLVFFVFRQVYQFKEGEYQTEIVELDTELVKAQKQVSELLQIAENKTLELTRKNEGVASLLVQVSEKQNQVSSLEKELSDSKIEVSRLKVELTQVNEKVSGSESELTRQVSDLKTTVTYLKGQLEKKENHITQLLAEIEKAGESTKIQEIANLRRSLSQYLNKENYEAADKVKKRLIELGVSAESLKV